MGFGKNLFSSCLTFASYLLINLFNNVFAFHIRYNTYLFLAYIYIV